MDYGDNLDLLRRYIKDETVDLVYLDPPLENNQDHRVRPPLALDWGIRR